MNKVEETIKKHKHEVPVKCDHKGELEHCDKCDEVYCKKCGKEWGQYGITWEYTDGTNATTACIDWDSLTDVARGYHCNF